MVGKRRREGEDEDGKQGGTHVVDSFVGDSN
jgi:hypothetical protein